MKLPADESCAGPVISALRAAGHALVSIAEVGKGSSDETVIALAMADRRVLITEDRDFRELVFARGYASAGVVLVRFPRRARKSKPNAVVQAVQMTGQRLLASFTVVEPGHVRVTRPFHK